MYAKWKSVSYVVQTNLMNDLLESFSLVFEENKYTNLKRYSTTFCYKTDYSPLKIVKNWNFGYNGYKALIKYI